MVPCIGIALSGLARKGRAIFILLVCTISLLGCSEEKASSAGAVSAKNDDLSPQPCAAGQQGFETGYQNFPGKHCAEIFSVVSSSRTQVGYRKRCQQLTGSDQRPKMVARVQLNECGPLKQEEGNYASMLVCCAAPASQGPAPMETYNATLQCPKGQVQALAMDLHFPQQTCGDAVVDAQSSLDSASYRRACSIASNSSQGRQRILDAAAFTCREDAGAMLDVAICCSAQLPPGREMRPLEVPDDLWESLRQGDLLGIQLLLSRYPQRVQERGPGGVTPLHLAGKLPITNALLGKRAALEARDDDGATPLHFAVRGRLEEVVQRLLEVGANVDAPTNGGDTPLSFAATKGLAELLLAHGASPNAGVSASPLHSASFYGRTEVARLLIATDADIDRPDSNGETPLHRAAFRQKIEVVRLLLSSGATINVRSNAPRPKTALDMTDNSDIVALLESHGAVSGREWPN